MFRSYVRVSTIEQAAEGRTSISEQQRIIRGIALTQGIEAPDIALYADPGVSGSIPLRNRPAGARLLADTQPGDVICAAKLDRMFRDALDAQEVYRDFKAQKVDLILYDLGPDPVTRSGGLSKVFFQIVSVFADAERERIAERMRDGKLAKRNNGGHIGGMAPYGYRVAGTGRDAVLEPHEPEQEVIRIAVGLHQKLGGLGPVTREMARRGYKDRAGTEFQYVQVQRMVQRVLPHIPRVTQ